jgi:hypothetical protein
VPHEQVAPETEGVVIGNHTHWTRRGFVRFVPEVREVTSPFPRTTVWATLPDHDGVNRG